MSATDEGGAPTEGRSSHEEALKHKGVAGLARQPR